MRRMASCLFGTFVLGAVALYAQKVEKEGKAWLARHTEPAEINVTGAWQSEDWGLYTLNQEKGSREITGEGEWKVDGVVSGKKVFLLFSWEGRVEYSAELELEGENRLLGRFSSGLMTEGSKKRPILFTR